MGVPFVDVVATMIDSSIPLTTNEWEEWGNVNEEKYFKYMMEYCPMQNVKEARYPACLLTCGFHDSRVQYWEAAKFAATLRHKSTSDSGPVLVKVEMSAGHFSASDRSVIHSLEMLSSRRPYPHPRFLALVTTDTNISES